MHFVLVISAHLLGLQPKLALLPQSRIREMRGDSKAGGKGVQFDETKYGQHDHSPPGHHVS